MACFTASVARNELWTQPTLLHDANRPRQRTDPIGLTPQQYKTLIEGMEKVSVTGTAARVFGNRRVLAPLGISVAAKTGTAQVRTARGTLNIAWMIAFAPVEDPQIALAIAIEGDTPGEETGGGRYAGPVAHAMLQAWLERKNARAVTPFRFKAE
jgi:penicillin-binding protein 2